MLFELRAEAVCGAGFFDRLKYYSVFIIIVDVNATHHNIIVVIITMSVQASGRTTLVSLVEEHVTTLIRQAVEVKRHSKRARYHQHHSGNGGILRQRLHAADINLALQWRGSEKLYATGTVIIPPEYDEPEDASKTTQKQIQHNSAKNKNSSVRLEEYLKSEMQLRPPSEVGLTSHWLAVDGIQPEIPHNPPPPATTTTLGGDDGAVLDSHHPGNRQQQQLLLLRQSPSTNASGNHELVRNGTAIGGGDNNNPGGGGIVSVNQLLPRLLSEELQLYFVKITSAIQRGGATPRSRQQQDDALARVAGDTGIQELVPFLTEYIVKEIHRQSYNPDHCRVLIGLLQAMLRNPSLHLELHLHLLVSPLITCVVIDTATAANHYNSIATGEEQQQQQQQLQQQQPGNYKNHWALRRIASETLVRVCHLFGDEYPTLKSRILQKLCEAITPDKPYNTIYGGIVSISYFGSKTIDAFLLPSVIPYYWNTWQETLYGSGRRQAAAAAATDEKKKDDKDKNDDGDPMDIDATAAEKKKEEEENKDDTKKRKRDDEETTATATTASSSSAATAATTAAATSAATAGDDKKTETTTAAAAASSSGGAAAATASSSSAAAASGGGEKASSSTPTTAKAAAAAAAAAATTTTTATNKEAASSSSKIMNQNNDHVLLQQLTEIHMCQQAVLDALGMFLRRYSNQHHHNAAAHRASAAAADNSKSAQQTTHWNDLEDTFGDTLVMLHGQETEYSFSFV